MARLHRLLLSSFSTDCPFDFAQGRLLLTAFYVPRLFGRLITGDS